jgi:hypothetical protein
MVDAMAREHPTRLEAYREPLPLIVSRICHADANGFETPDQQPRSIARSAKSE